MDQGNFSSSDSTVLLLNEVDILLAQTRLMELYVRQAQVTATRETARLTEQHHAELATLRASLAEKDQLVQRQTEIVAEQQNLAEQVQQISNRLEENQRLLDHRDHELESARTENAALHGAIAELENTNRIAQNALLEAANAQQNLEAELPLLHRQIEQNRADLEKEQLGARQLKQSLQKELAEAQTELRAEQSRSQTTAGELADARAEISGLKQQVTELHASRQQTEAEAASERAQARAGFAEEIANLQAALSAQRESEQESQAARSEIETNLQNEITSLRHELEEKHKQLASRDHDRRQAEGEIERWRQTVAELEAAKSQNTAKEIEFEKIRCEYEDRIGELDQVIMVKERELIERREAMTAVESALHGRLQDLQGELSRSRATLSAQESALEEVKIANSTLRDQIQALEESRAELTASHQRILDQTLQQSDDQVNRLHASLAENEKSLKESAEASRALEQRLGAEIVAFQERNLALEQARQEAEENWQRSGAIQAELQSRLKARTEEHDQARASANEIREQLGARINELQAEIAQQQLSAESLRAEISALQDRLGQAAVELAQTQSANAQSAGLLQETEQSRQAYQIEINRLNQDYQSQLQNLTSELAQERERADNIAEHNQELTHFSAKLERELVARSDSLTAANGEIAALQARLDDLSRALEQQQGETHSRMALENELTMLRQNSQQITSTLSHQQAVVANQQNQIQSLEENLRQQSTIGAELRENLEKAQAESARSQQRTAELEDSLERERQAATTHAEQIRQDYDARIDRLNAALAEKSTELENHRTGQADLEQALRQELREKSWALAQQQAAAEEMAATHRTQLEKIEAKLYEQRRLSHLPDGELEKATARANALQRRSDELEVALRHAELTAVSRAEQARQDTAAQIDQLNAELTQKTRELDEHLIAQTSLEQSLRQEMNRLIRAVEERDQMLANRSDELGRVKADRDGAHDRVSQLEASRVSVDHSRSVEVEHLRREYQTQLSSLQEELGERERALREHQENDSAMAQKHCDEIETLRLQLAQRASADGKSFGVAPSESTPRPVETSDASGVDIAYFDAHLHERRWRNGFSTKRRWKL